MRSGVVVHEDEVGTDCTSVGSDDGVADFIPISHSCERSVLEDMQIYFVPHADAALDHDGTTAEAIVLGDVVVVEALVPPPPRSFLAVSHIETNLDSSVNNTGVHWFMVQFTWLRAHVILARLCLVVSLTRSGAALE